MTTEEFKFLVKEMRNAQKQYFQNKQYTTLVVAKALEKQVDKELSAQIDMFSKAENHCDYGYIPGCPLKVKNCRTCKLVNPIK